MKGKQEINPDRRFDGTGSWLRILERSSTTPPHHLVLRIIDPKPFSCAATEWGKAHEACALDEYRKHYHSRGNPDAVMSNAGFSISEDHPFLGASPDGYVYDPNAMESYGLVKVKCPYKYRGMHQLMLV